MAAWKPPLIVAALAVPVVVGFWLGGGGAGVAVGALAAAAIVVIAARQRPRGPIGAAVPDRSRRRVLLVVTCAVEAPAAVRTIAAAAGLEGDGGAEVLVLAPARIGFLDRWASDVEGARQAAQQNLVATVAALAKAGIVAEARVGDEDIVQAAEDQLQSFAANEVVLVSGGGVGEAGDANDLAAATELESRLRPGFCHVVLDG
jgi:hypothetical protein